MSINPETCSPLESILPDDIIYLIGKHSPVFFYVPLPIAFTSPSLLQHFSPSQPERVIRLPDYKAEDFEQYVTWLLTARECTGQDCSPMGHPLEKTLTWRECLPLLSSYAFACRLGDAEFVGYIKSELERWRNPRQSRDLDVLQLIFAERPAPNEVKRYLVGNMYREREDVPDVLRRYWDPIKGNGRDESCVLAYIKKRHGTTTSGAFSDLKCKDMLEVRKGRDRVEFGIDTEGGPEDFSSASEVDPKWDVKYSGMGRTNCAAPSNRMRAKAGATILRDENEGVAIQRDYGTYTANHDRYGDTFAKTACTASEEQGFLWKFNMLCGDIFEAIGEERKAYEKWLDDEASTPDQALNEKVGGYGGPKCQLSMQNPSQRQYQRRTDSRPMSELREEVEAGLIRRCHTKKLSKCDGRKPTCQAPEDAILPGNASLLCGRKSVCEVNVPIESHAVHSARQSIRAVASKNLETPRRATGAACLGSLPLQGAAQTDKAWPPLPKEAHIRGVDSFGVLSHIRDGKACKWNSSRFQENGASSELVVRGGLSPGRAVEENEHSIVNTPDRSSGTAATSRGTGNRSKRRKFVECLMDIHGGKSSSGSVMWTPMV